MRNVFEQASKWETEAQTTAVHFAKKAAQTLVDDVRKDYQSVNSTVGGHVALEISKGVYHLVTEHPEQLAVDAVVLPAVALVAEAIAVPAAAVGIAALTIASPYLVVKGAEMIRSGEARDLVQKAKIFITNEKNLIDVEQHPELHSQAERAKADAQLESLGADAAHVLAGGVGGLARGAVANAAKDLISMGDDLAAGYWRSLLREYQREPAFVLPIPKEASFGAGRTSVHVSRDIFNGMQTALASRAYLGSQRDLGWSDHFGSNPGHAPEMTVPLAGGRAGGTIKHIQKKLFRGEHPRAIRDTEPSSLIVEDEFVPKPPRLEHKPSPVSLSLHERIDEADEDLIVSRFGLNSDQSVYSEEEIDAGLPAQRRAEIIKRLEDGWQAHPIDSAFVPKVLQELKLELQDELRQTMRSNLPEDFPKRYRWGYHITNWRNQVKSEIRQIDYPERLIGGQKRQRPRLSE